MKNKNIAVVVTVLNEEKTIGKLIDSVVLQTILPQELVIVDGGSKDKTKKVIDLKIKQHAKKIKINFFLKPGNRSIGRNFAIKKTNCDFILITDSGCILDKNWIKEIIKPFSNPKVEVVSGYYKGLYKNIFQKSLLPYVLVMPDKADKDNFLPSTRSMAIRKTVFKKAGFFNEHYSHNEDYVFANTLKNLGIIISFAPKALVYWIPRSNVRQVFNMFYRFAFGDIESGILRTSVFFLYLRYFWGMYLLLLSFIQKSIVLYAVIFALIFSYLIWIYFKNYRYVKDFKGFIYLPLIQLCADFAVIFGSSKAIFKKINKNSIKNYFTGNQGLILIICIYVLLMINIISIGIPNINHPFNYFMDEWHQSQSIRNLFTLGSPNVEGSANGSIFHFLISGIYLIPFALFNIVNPFQIQSSVTQLEIQKSFFEILRLNTLLFGIFSIIIFYQICKKYFNLSPLIATFLFVFNPIWIILSNYFKYDIALIFWILLSFWSLIKYSVKPTLINFSVASILCAISLSVKLSTPSLLIVLIIIFILFTPKLINNFKNLIIGLCLYFLIFISFGIPDVLLGKGNLYEYLFSNLIRTPILNMQNIILPSDLWQYFLIKLYPSVFGYILFLGFIISFIFLLITNAVDLIKNKKKLNIYIHNNHSILITFIVMISFAISLFSIGIEAVNNRLLVLLPFMAIVISIFIKRIDNIFSFKKIKLLINFILIIFLSIQLLQSLSWYSVRLFNDPRVEASNWIKKNIPFKSTIGIMNIPIYQMLPDIIVKEFYFNQYNINNSQIYEYSVLDLNNIKMPKYIVLSNTSIETKYLRKSDKKIILDKMKNNNYKIIADFKPNFYYLKYFANDLDYYMSGLVQMPLNITIYEKQ